ncbi:hypothetical protein NPIL_349911, partial [Nephila pilipes]
EELTNLFCENDFFTTWDAYPTIEYNFKSHRKEMSSSDEEILKCERHSVEYEPHSCEPLDLSIRATRYASSHSGEPSISSLLVNEGSPSDCQPVAPSALPGPKNGKCVEGGLLAVVQVLSDIESLHISAQSFGPLISDGKQGKDSKFSCILYVLIGMDHISCFTLSGKSYSEET